MTGVVAEIAKLLVRVTTIKLSDSRNLQGKYTGRSYLGVRMGLMRWDWLA